MPPFCPMSGLQGDEPWFCVLDYDQLPFFALAPGCQVGCSACADKSVGGGQWAQTGTTAQGRRYLVPDRNQTHRDSFGRIRALPSATGDGIGYQLFPARGVGFLRAPCFYQSPRAVECFGNFCDCFMQETFFPGEPDPDRFDCQPGPGQIAWGSFPDCFFYPSGCCGWNSASDVFCRTQNPPQDGTIPVYFDMPGEGGEYPPYFAQFHRCTTNAFVTCIGEWPDNVNRCGRHPDVPHTEFYLGNRGNPEREVFKRIHVQSLAVSLAPVRGPLASFRAMENRILAAMEADRVRPVQNRILKFDQVEHQFFDSAPNAALGRYHRQFLAERPEQAMVVEEWPNCLLQRSGYNVRCSLVIREAAMMIQLVPHMVHQPRRQGDSPLAPGHTLIHMFARARVTAKLAVILRSQGGGSSIAQPDFRKLPEVVDGRDRIVYNDSRGARIAIPPDEVAWYGFRGGAARDFGADEYNQNDTLFNDTDQGKCCRLAAQQFLLGDALIRGWPSTCDESGCRRNTYLGAIRWNFNIATRPGQFRGTCFAP